MPPDAGHDRAGHDPGRAHGHHDHDHGADARRAGERHAGRLAAAFVLTVTVLVVEVVVGLAARSLALLSDAGHMATDALGLGMALAAVHLATRAGRRSGRSFGLYRLEILAALANVVLLFGVAGYVLYQAFDRMGTSHVPDGGPVIAAAAVGLVANVVAFSLLRPGAAESLNVRGAYLEVVADLVGSIGVLAGALVFTLTGWGWVDPVVGAALGLWILPRTWRLGREAVRVLVQAAPVHIDLDDLAGDLAGISGVVDVHDLHVWTLTSEMEVATAHLVVASVDESHDVLDRARDLLATRYGIRHATLQVEPADHTGCDDLSW